MAADTDIRIANDRASGHSLDRLVRQRLVDAIKRDIRNIGCIYRSVGDALYDEPVNRLAERIASTVERELPNTKLTYRP